METQPTIEERREELSAYSFRKLRKLFIKAERYGGQHWVDKRKRKDLVQGILNIEIGVGGRLGL